VFGIAQHVVGAPGAERRRAFEHGPHDVAVAPEQAFQGGAGGGGGGIVRPAEALVLDHAADDFCRQDGGQAGELACLGGVEGQQGADGGGSSGLSRSIQA
jgi:hypothetical protein